MSHFCKYKRISLITNAFIIKIVTRNPRRKTSVTVAMADEDGEEEFDKLDHIINSSGCAKELELSKGNAAITWVRETISN